MKTIITKPGKTARPAVSCRQGARIIKPSLSKTIPHPTVKNQVETEQAKRRFAVLCQCLEARGFSNPASIVLSLMQHGIEDARNRVVLAFYNAVKDASAANYNTDAIDEVFLAVRSYSPRGKNCSGRKVTA